MLSKKPKRTFPVTPQCCNFVNSLRQDSRGAVNGLMREVIKGHLTEHIVHQGEELKREEDLEVVLKVLDSYIK